jgi:hypothetical protein
MGTQTQVRCMVVSNKFRRLSAYSCEMEGTSNAARETNIQNTSAYNCTTLREITDRRKALNI